MRHNSDRHPVQACGEGGRRAAQLDGEDLRSRGSEPIQGSEMRKDRWQFTRGKPVSRRGRLQQQFGGITDFDEIEAIGRRRSSEARAVAALQQFMDLGFLPLPRTNPAQRAGDVSHHAQQKGIRGDIDDHPGTMPSHQHMIDPPVRCWRLTGGRTERAEVMLASQKLRRTMHRGIIQRTARGSAGGEQGRRFPFEEEVEVSATGGGKTRVETRTYGPHPSDPDTFGKMTVDASEPRGSAAQSRGFEADHLGSGMDPGIGPSGRSQAHRRCVDGEQCFLEGILDTPAIGLVLEPLEPFPGIGQAQREQLVQDARLSSSDWASWRCAGLPSDKTS